MENPEQRFGQEVQEDEPRKEQEKVELRSYENLSPPEKVKAILSEVKQPVSRKFVVELSGLIPEELSEKDRGAIHAIFEGEEVEKFYDKEMGEYLYRLKTEASGFSLEGVDRVSVNKQIADILWEELFGQEGPEAKQKIETKIEPLRTPEVSTKNGIEEKAGPSEEEMQNAERFIIHFIVDNDSLTAEGKAFMQDIARSKRGSWSVKDHVTGVAQEGNRIVIRFKSGGSANYYLGKPNL